MIPTPNQIREARHAAGMSQSQAAELIHVSRRAWQNWEQGLREMHEAFWELFEKKIARTVDTG